MGGTAIDIEETLYKSTGTALNAHYWNPDEVSKLEFNPIPT